MLKKWTFLHDDTGTQLKGYRADVPGDDGRIHTIIHVQARRALETANDGHAFAASTQPARDLAADTFLVEAVATCIARLRLAEDVGLDALRSWLPHRAIDRGEFYDHYRACYRYELLTR